MTAHEYVDFFGRAFGLRGVQLRTAVAEVEDFTGITAISKKNLKSLSKGMKQRVSLARALVHNPQVLVMDEPANGLDPRARIELRELVRALAESGKAILISSHILAELAEMCSEVAIIEKGVLVSGGSLAALSREAQAVRRIVLQALAPAPQSLCALLLEMADVISAVPHGHYCVAELNDTGDQGVAALLAALVTRDVQLLEFRQERADLEDIFMKVTKGDLA